ncbi:hypothetical protein D3C87_1925420 [compost metagenome]
MAGIIGEANTAVGTPASLSSLIASRRRAGEEARGSILRLSLWSIEVIDRATLTSPSLASSLRMSRSRMISADLVVIITGWRVSSITSRMPRVSLCLRSAGWYGSVLVPMAMGLTL